jgi:dCMP deaminase
MGINERIMTEISNWDYRFLDLATLVSSWSKDPSTKTGAVIVGPDKGVISVGFNGFPSGMPDGQELYENREEKYSRVVHCEVNALLFAHRAIPAGSTLYTVPFMSCDRCVVQMLQAGIKRFVAPLATADKLERWGDAFNKTRKYILECGGELAEVKLNA